jgi:hypothetical protein
MYRVSIKKILKWCYIDNSNFEVKNRGVVMILTLRGYIRMAYLKKKTVLRTKNLGVGN